MSDLGRPTDTGSVIFLIILVITTGVLVQTKVSLRKASMRLKRMATGTAFAVLAGTVGYTLGGVGPYGLLWFPKTVMGIALVAGPGALLLGLPLAFGLENWAQTASSRSAIRWAGGLTGVPLGFLGLIPAALLRNTQLGMALDLYIRNPWAAGILGALFGGIGLGLGVVVGLNPGAKS